MTDEKKKPEDEISDEQLEDVAGGAKIGDGRVISPPLNQQPDPDLTAPKPDATRNPTADTALQVGFIKTLPDP